MRLFLAGIYPANFNESGNIYKRLWPAEKAARDEVENILESYHYVFRQSFVEKLRVDGRKIFLDSGAFSAFTKGISVNAEKYCDYIKRNEDVIEVASVLDGIGDPLKTWQNQKLMEEMGTRPLPCFHYGEDERYLEYYIDNYEYITLGGMVPISTPNLKLWLDRIWERYLCDKDGKPKLRVHGFGMTTASLMGRYPWYSVDSSSWVQIASTGNIIMPNQKVLAVSHNSPNRKMENQHFDTMTPPQKDAIVEMIESYGFTLARLQETYEPRWAWNCMMFSRLGKNNFKQDLRFQPDQIGLF